MQYPEIYNWGSFKRNSQQKRDRRPLRGLFGEIEFVRSFLGSCVAYALLRPRRTGENEKKTPLPRVETTLLSPTRRHWVPCCRLLAASPLQSFTWRHPAYRKAFSRRRLFISVSNIDTRKSPGRNVRKISNDMMSGLMPNARLYVSGSRSPGA